MGDVALVGCFGKLPCVGDFVQRRLPAEFVNPWDGAFEEAVAMAKTRLGPRWDAAWPDMPPWRFVLAAGACGPACWAGVLGPSADRVGRTFPMVLAAPVPASMLAQLVRVGGAWFAALEDALRADSGRIGVEAFDASLQALPPPEAWLQRSATAGLPVAVGASVLDWPRNAEDRWLEGLWQAGCDQGARGLWWTCGHARMPPRARLLADGLPRAEFVDFLLADTAVSASDTLTPASVPVHEPAPVAGAPSDSLADLLGTPVEAPLAGEPHVEPVFTPEPRRSLPVGDKAHVATRSRPDLVWVVADVDAEEGRRQAARQAQDLLEDMPRPLDMAALQTGLLALHPALRERAEDLLDPVREDAALVVASVRAGQAWLLRVGAACAWHGRRGQWRPLFGAVADPVHGAPDGVPPDPLSDMLGVTPSRNPLTGLGARADLRCDRAECLLERGDRLVLLADRALIRVQADTLAWAWEAGVEQEARVRLATAAGLDGDPGLWPLATIEVGE